MRKFWLDIKVRVVSGILLALITFICSYIYSEYLTKQFISVVTYKVPVWIAFTVLVVILILVKIFLHLKRPVATTKIVNGVLGLNNEGIEVLYSSYLDYETQVITIEDYSFYCSEHKCKMVLMPHSNSQYYCPDEDCQILYRNIRPRAEYVALIESDIRRKMNTKN